MRQSKARQSAAEQRQSAADAECAQERRGEDRAEAEPGQGDEL